MVFRGGGWRKRKGSSLFTRRRKWRTQKRFTLGSAQRVIAGSNALTTASLTIGVTSTDAIANSGDFGLAIGWDAKNRPAYKMSWIKVAGAFSLAQGVNVNEIGELTLLVWLLKASPEVRSDWVLNGRDPNDGTDVLGTITSANPYKIVGIPKVVRLVAENVGSVATFIATTRGGKFNLFARNEWFRYPENLYFAYQVRSSHFTAGNELDPTDVEFTYNVEWEGRRPITV